MLERYIQFFNMLYATNYHHDFFIINELNWVGGRSVGGNVFASEEYPEYVCGSVNDAFGFFQRYWYIIVPMLIMQMITVPEEEEKPQGEGQQQGVAGDITGHRG